jgi:hypothetical protein
MHLVRVIADEADSAVTRLIYGLHQVGDGHGLGVKQDRCLRGGEIDFDLIDARKALERFLDALLTLMAVHTLDSNNYQVVVFQLGRHISCSSQSVPLSDHNTLEPGAIEGKPFRPKSHPLDKPG